MNLLPVCELFGELEAALSNHNQLILEAPTGAGKSTALPLAALDWSAIEGKIIMLEPRRVAARSVARFIANRRGCQLGTEVGYRVRGDSRVSAATRLEVVTEGILTRMIQHDPELAGVGLIIFDEIHERHLSTDLGLALALEVQAGLREDLKILAMSATLSGLPLQALMPAARVLTSAGRAYPVVLEYSKVPTGVDWLDHMGRLLVELASGKRALPDPVAPGTILAFLPGKAEIERLSRYVAERVSDQVVICPLYGELDAAAQDKALLGDEHGRRKLVLATNVAESSLTIEGVTQVVDAGWVRRASFNPRSGVTRLRRVRISQASAIQRAGRAGRVAPGVCLRLWSAEEYERQIKADEPEIMHSDLVGLALEAAAWGERDLGALKLLSRPPRVNEGLAWQLLKELELVDDSHRLTALGRAAHQLGCHPRLAHMLLKAKAMGEAEGDECLAPLACLLAAVLEGRGLPRRGCDISHYLDWAVSGQAGQQARQWLSLLGLNGDLRQIAHSAHPRDCGLLLALAYPDRIAMARGDGFVLANGTGLSVEEGDAMALVAMMVAADFAELDGRSAGRLWLGAPLDVKLFDGPLAFLVRQRQVSGFDEFRGRFVAERQRVVGQLVLEREPMTRISPQLRTDAWINRIRQKGLWVLNLGEDAAQLRQRVTLAAELLGGDWPPMDDDALLSSLEQWLGPYLSDINTLEQFSKLDVARILADFIGWSLRVKLDEELPTHYPMATGTRAPIRYEPDGRAMLRVRLQEAFGMAATPLLAGGRLRLTMELLSPAQRPLALTADLASFWQGPYQEVKKEMRGRYPKHLWPDEPANTLPTKFTKKKTLGQA